MRLPHQTWLTACVAVAAVLPTPAPAAARTAVPAQQEVAALLTSHVAFAVPNAKHTRIRTIPWRRPITHARTVLPVIGQATTSDGAHWLHVRLPGRPNGTTGWIAQGRTLVGQIPWHIVVRPAARRVLVYRSGRLVRSFEAIVGKPSTPTPRGHFFVEESVRMLSGAPGGPFALALSARSDVLQEFDGGPGQIALHGLENLGGTLGTAESHGCVRLANRNITWLADRIGGGVPVDIR